jgi:glutamine synthetase type III
MTASRAAAEKVAQRFPRRGGLLVPHFGVAATRIVPRNFASLPAPSAAGEKVSIISAEIVPERMTIMALRPGCTFFAHFFENVYT